MQRTLDREQARLRDAGVWFAQTDVVRPAVSTPLFAADSPALLRGPLRTLARRRIRAWVAARAAEGWERLVLSDEVMLGHLDLALTPAGPYPTVTQRLRLLAEALDDWPVEAVAALREPAGWYASAYAFALSRRPQKGFAPVRAAALGARRGFADLAAEIRAVFPQTTFWRAEVHAAQPWRVHSLLVGAEVAAGIWRPRREVNASQSGAAVAELEATWARFGKVDDTLLVDLRRRLPIATHGPFQPWSAEDRVLLAARWEVDLAAIRASGASLLEPRAAGPASPGDPMDKRPASQDKIDRAARARSRRRDARRARTGEAT